MFLSDKKYYIYNPLLRNIYYSIKHFKIYVQAKLLQVNSYLCNIQESQEFLDIVKQHLEDLIIEEGNSHSEQKKMKSTILKAFLMYTLAIYELNNYTYEKALFLFEETETILKQATNFFYRVKAEDMVKKTLAQKMQSGITSYRTPFTPTPFISNTPSEQSKSQTPRKNSANLPSSKENTKKALSALSPSKKLQLQMIKGEITQQQFLNQRSSSAALTPKAKQKLSANIKLVDEIEE